MKRTSSPPKPSLSSLRSPARRPILQRGGSNSIGNSPIRLFVVAVVVIWTWLFVVVPWEHRQSDQRHFVGKHLDEQRQSLSNSENGRSEPTLQEVPKADEKKASANGENHDRSQVEDSASERGTDANPSQRERKGSDGTLGIEYDPFLAYGDDDDDDDVGGAAPLHGKKEKEESTEAQISRALEDKWIVKAQHKSMLRQTRTPPIAWLMSFPNSGTSFTMQLTMVASQQTTATNYADEEGGVHITDFAVYGSASPSGPFYLQQHQWPYRSGHVLTKTHCAGFCMFCPPQVLMARTHNMRKTCSTGFRLLPDSGPVRQAMELYAAKVREEERKKMERLQRKDQARERDITLRILDRQRGKESEYDRDDDDDYYQDDYGTMPMPMNLTAVGSSESFAATDGNGTTPLPKVRLDGRYDSDLVRKAVHLFRDPLDNIVSRFHHYVQTNAPDLSDLPDDVPPPPPPSSYPDDPVGFRAFCQDVDSRVEAKSTFRDVLEYRNPGSSATSPLLKRLEYRQFPCYSDLFRYIHWHNLAVDLLEEEMSDISSMTLYYEEYRNDVPQVLQRLFGFLELEQRADPPPFDGMNKTYHHYFTPEERRTAIRIMAQAATPKLWLLLRRYVQDLLH